MIREYCHEDIETIFTINKESFDKPEPNVGLLAAIHKGMTWVYLVNNKVVGFIVTYTVNSQAHIYNVAVASSHRNQGIGTKLLTKFEEFYRGLSLGLLVHMDNPAQKLYFDSGYRVTDVKKDYYYPDQHALVMVKVV